MAKSIKTSARKGNGPPDPREIDAFRKWLGRQPREWSVTIAARAALRVLPLVGRADNLSDVVLPAFRARACARFAANLRDR
jgi:hypothetical protein